MNINLIYEGNKYEFDIGPETNVEYVKDLSGKIFGSEMDIFYKEENLSKYGEKALIKDIIPIGDENIIINVQKINSKVINSKASTSISNSPKINSFCDNEQYYQSLKKKFMDVESDYSKTINDTISYEHILDDRFNKIIKIIKDLKKQSKDIIKKTENFYSNNNNFDELENFFRNNQTSKNLNDEDIKNIENKLNILSTNYKYIEAQNNFQKNIILYLQSKIELFLKIKTQLQELENKDNFDDMIKEIEKLFLEFEKSNDNYKPIKLKFTNLNLKIEPEEMELLKMKKKNKKAFNLSDIPDDLKKKPNISSKSPTKILNHTKNDILHNHKPFGVFKISNLRKLNNLESLKTHKNINSLTSIELKSLTNQNKTLESEKSEVNNSQIINNSKPIQLFSNHLIKNINVDINKKFLYNNNLAQEISPIKKKRLNNTLENKQAVIPRILNKPTFEIEKTHLSNTLPKLNENENLKKLKSDINIPFISKRLNTSKSNHIEEKITSKENKIITDDNKINFKKNEDNRINDKKKEENNDTFESKKIKFNSKKDIKQNNKIVFNMIPSERSAKKSKTNIVIKLIDNEENIEDENKKKKNEEFTERKQIRNRSKKLLSTTSKESVSIDKEKIIKVGSFNSPTIVDRNKDNKEKNKLNYSSSNASPNIIDRNKDNKEKNKLNISSSNASSNIIDRKKDILKEKNKLNNYLNLKEDNEEINLNKKRSKNTTLKIPEVKSDIVQKMKKKNMTVKKLGIEFENTDDEKDNSFLKIKNSNSELTKENIQKLTKNLSNKRIINYKGFPNNNPIINNNEVNNSLNKNKNTKESLKKPINSNSDIENSNNDSKNSESDSLSDNHTADKRKKKKKQVNKYDFII